MNRNFELSTFTNPFIRVTITDDHKVVTDGYILKSATTEEVHEGIAVVASGGRYLCDELKKRSKPSKSNK